MTKIVYEIVECTTERHDSCTPIAALSDTKPNSTRRETAVTKTGKRSKPFANVKGQATLKILRTDVTLGNMRPIGALCLRFLGLACQRLAHI
jgi:hypothetical protein